LQHGKKTPSINIVYSFIFDLTLEKKINLDKNQRGIQKSLYKIQKGFFQDFFFKAGL